MILGLLPLLASAILTGSTFKVTSPDASLKLDSFYKKQVTVRGIPILSSVVVAAAALQRGAGSGYQMLSRGPNGTGQALISNHVPIAIIAATEQTTDIPECRILP